VPLRSAQRRALGRRGQRLGVAALSLVQVAAAQPEGHQHHAQLERLHGPGGQQGVDGAAQVGGVAVQAGRPAVGARQREAPARLASVEHLGLARLVEPVARVEPHGLQQSVAALARRRLERHHERLLHQPRQHVGDRRGLERVVGADRFGGLEIEAAGEHGQAPEQRALVGLEQVVAPFERGGQRLLPRRGRVAAGAEHAEAVAEPLRDRGRPQRAEPTGGELDCERQPIEPEADPGHVGGVVGVEREVGCDGVSALHEQLHGLVGHQLLRRARLSRVGDVQRRDAEHDLAGHA